MSNSASPYPIVGPPGPAGPPGPETAGISQRLVHYAGSIAPIAGATGTGKMGGLGANTYFTPRRTGWVLVILVGNIYAQTAGGLCWTTLRYGVGNAPAIGTVVNANHLGAGTYNVYWNSTYGSQVCPATHFSMFGPLAIGTRYWVDVSLWNSGAVSTVAMNYVLCQVIEL